MTLYVSHLTQYVKEEDLIQLFSQYGEVTSAKVVINRISGLSRKFAFVEMPKEHEAKKAILRLHKMKLDHQTIYVKQARQPQAVLPFLKH